MQKRAIIGTAGHIDHGKTALVKALTGVDADRLPEEKARGITIDLGFVHATIGDTEVSFIDVPGHEKFVRNMLAGIGGIDLLMMVVAADESVMPQTKEHFDICTLLEIPGGIVVITKTDLVDRETLTAVRTDIEKLTRGSFLENAAIFPVSSRTGEGIDALRNGLQQNLSRLRPRNPEGIFRMPIDRVFTLKGHGTIVTGTIIEGSISKDQIVQVLPGQGESRVRARSIHAHDRAVDRAIAGQRTAINLQGIEKDQIQRGDVLLDPDTLQPTSLLNVRLRILNSARPLLHNSLVRFHHQTAETLARITLLESESLAPGASGLAQLRLQRPVIARAGDRFIIRKSSPLLTVAGGLIIDHYPQRRLRPANRKMISLLQRLEPPAAENAFPVAVLERGGQGANEQYLVSKLGIPAGKLRDLNSPDVIWISQEPLLAISKTVFDQTSESIQKLLKDYFQQNQISPGISKREFLTRNFPHRPLDVMNRILQKLSEQKTIRLEKELLSLPGREILLNPQDQSQAEQIQKTLKKAGLEFPGMEKLQTELKISPEVLRKLIYHLVRAGTLVKISDDYFLDRSFWEDLKSRVRAFKQQKQKFSVPEFKEAFGVSRKYAIPLLEQLDREGITRRSGNERIIL